MKALYIKYHNQNNHAQILKDLEIQKKISFIISDKDVSIKNIKKNIFDIIIIEQYYIETKIISNFILNKIKTPIIILYHESTAKDRSNALLCGCDDCILCTIEPIEFYAKIKSITRRYHGYSSSLLEIGRLKIDFEKKEVYIDKNKLNLTLKEYSLFEIIIQKKDSLLDKKYILKKIYNDDNQPNAKIIDVLLSKIRKKIKLMNIDNPFLTVWGGGYKLNEAAFLIEERYNDNVQDIYEGKSIPIQPGISILNKRESP